MPDQLGGLQRYVRQLAGALAAMDQSVTILTKRVSRELPMQEEYSDGVRHKRYPVPSRSSPLYALAYPVASVSATWAASRDAGILHIHYPLQGLGATIGRARYVHTFHAPMYRELLPEHQDRYFLPNVLRRPLVSAARATERRVAMGSSATVVLTEYMKSELEQLSGEAAGRAVKIPAGLDADFFSPGPGVGHEGARAGFPVLFTARRFVPRTGVVELVEAMPLVLARFPAARLAIAGDGPLRERVRRAVGELGLEDKVFLLGRVSDTKLRDWYRTADLFVLPTQELEGFGMATIEALACGTPALGTPVGGTPEILRPIDRRLVAAGAAPEDLAAAVVEIVATDGLLASLAARVRGHVVPSMTWSTIADRHMEIYERVRCVSYTRSRTRPLTRRASG